MGCVCVCVRVPSEHLKFMFSLRKKSRKKGEEEEEGEVGQWALYWDLARSRGKLQSLHPPPPPPLNCQMQKLSFFKSDGERVGGEGLCASVHGLLQRKISGVGGGLEGTFLSKSSLAHFARSCMCSVYFCTSCFQASSQLEKRFDIEVGKWSRLKKKEKC